MFFPSQVGVSVLAPLAHCKCLMYQDSGHHLVARLKRMLYLNRITRITEAYILATIAQVKLVLLLVVRVQRPVILHFGTGMVRHGWNICDLLRVGISESEQQILQTC